MMTVLGAPPWPTEPEPEIPPRSMLQTVARNTASMLGAQVALKLMAFAFSILVVRTLGSAHFGRYAAAQAYVGIFAVLTDLGLGWYTMREMARRPETVARFVPDTSALRAALSLVTIVLILCSAWLLGRRGEALLGIFVASCVLLAYAFQGPLEAMLISQERLDLSSTMMVVQQLTFMFLGTGLLALGAGYLGLLLASLCSVALNALLSARIARKVLHLRLERPDPRRWWPLLRATLPFGVSGLAGALASQFGTVFMSFVLTEAAVGWYSVPDNLALMSLMAAQSLATSMYPALVREYDSGRGSIRDTVQRAFRYLFLLSLPLAVGATILADRIILLLYGQGFVASIPILRIVVWSLPLLFVAEILGRTSLALHLERKAARVSMVNALINILLMILLVPRYGAIGAALAMVATRLARFIQSSLIVGPRMLYEGTASRLLRVLASGALMGGVIAALDRVPQVAALGDKAGLAVLVLVGALAYGAAAVLLGAMSPAEATYLWGAVRHRLRLRRQRA